MKKSVVVFCLLSIVLSGCTLNNETTPTEAIVVNTGTEIVNSIIDQTTGSIKQVEYSYVAMDSYVKNFDCLLGEEIKEEKECMQSGYMNTYKFPLFGLELQTWNTNILGEGYYKVENNKIYNPQQKEIENGGHEQILMYSGLVEAQNAIPGSGCVIASMSFAESIVDGLEEYEISNNRPGPLCNTQNSEAIMTRIFKNINNGKVYIFEGSDGCAPGPCTSYDSFKGL